MLIIAALLTLGVGAMHSIIGEKRLIQPLMTWSEFPRLFGSQALARTTIRIAWHLTTLIWIALAAVMAAIGVDPANSRTAFLLAMAVLFSVSAALPLLLSRGKHRSWVFFVPIAVLTWLAV